MARDLKNTYRRWKNLIILGLTVGVCSILALLMPVILTKVPCISPFFHLGQMGSVGDTFNGLSNPFLTSIAIAVTFSAFYIQYVANKRQWEYEKREQIERKFLLLLDLLNKQESQCKIENVGEAKQAFHYMFYEFKAILYYVVKSNIFEEVKNRKQLELKMTYAFFINGASYSATKRIISDFNKINIFSCNKETVEAINRELLIEQELSLKKSPEHAVFMLNDYKNKKIKYFDGHRCRLISFYRNICMIIQHLYSISTDTQNNKDDILFFMQTLYSQLSEHELALIKIIYIYGCEVMSGSNNMKIFFESLDNGLIDDYMNCEDDKFFKAILEKANEIPH